MLSINIIYNEFFLKFELISLDMIDF